MSQIGFCVCTSIRLMREQQQSLGHDIFTPRPRQLLKLHRLALVQHAGDAILNAKDAPECARALQSMFYENASPEKVIENAFYRDWNIDEIKRSVK